LLVLLLPRLFFVVVIVFVLVVVMVRPKTGERQQPTADTMWSHVNRSPNGLRDWQTELKKRLNAAATAPDEKHENVVRYFTSI
jgi:hypothetical protein